MFKAIKEFFFGSPEPVKAPMRVIGLEVKLSPEAAQRLNNTPVLAPSVVAKAPAKKAVKRGRPVGSKTKKK